MEVLGRDSAREAYRVAVGDAEGRIVGLVPDGLIAERRTLTGGHGHQAAYDWLAHHAAEIENTLRILRSGRGAPRPPFDRVFLEGE